MADVDGALTSCLHEYLQRISFPLPDDGSLPASTLKTLWQVHTQHALNISFENLSFVHHKLKAKERPIDVDALHNRIVRGGRGGMCQEMNSLLFHNLKLLGFDCYQGLASVVVQGSLRPAKTPFEGLVTSKNLGATIDVVGSHQIIFTCVNGAWYLCDVGFGGMGILEPLLLRAYDEPQEDSSSHNSSPDVQQQQQDWELLPGAAAAATAGCPGESHQSGSRFRLRRGVIGSAELLPADQAAGHPEALSHVGWYLQCCVKGNWEDVYYFNRGVVTHTVIAACAEASFRSHPLFTKHMVVTRPLPDGRMSLTDFVLKVRRQGRPSEQRQLSGEEERDGVLAEVFSINMAASGGDSGGAGQS